MHNTRSCSLSDHYDRQTTVCFKWQWYCLIDARWHLTSVISSNGTFFLCFFSKPSTTVTTIEECNASLLCPRRFMTDCVLLVMCNDIPPCMHETEEEAGDILSNALWWRQPVIGWVMGIFLIRPSRTHSRRVASTQISLLLIHTRLPESSFCTSIRSLLYRIWLRSPEESDSWYH